MIDPRYICVRNANSNPYDVLVLFKLPLSRRVKVLFSGYSKHRHLPERAGRLLSCADQCNIVYSQSNIPAVRKFTSGEVRLGCNENGALNCSQLSEAGDEDFWCVVFRK
jgi:hypothetical protein